MDKNLKCADCGEEFEFKEGEQKFYKEHNLIEPKRCRQCRAAKKEKNNSHHKK